MAQLVIYLTSFMVIWFGAGLVITSVERFSRSFKISSFAVSFLILGFFTSLSEASVGINAILDNDPEIFVGNLIGASIVIFLLIVPLLSIVGKTLIIQKEFRGFTLKLSLLVIGAPVLLALDGYIDRIDSLICILCYVILTIMVQKKRGFLESLTEWRRKSKVNVLWELIKIVVGVILIFAASNIIVEMTEYFSKLWGISAFLISLLVIALGTNLPELSLVLRSVIMKNKDIAFGDYVGSASFNTFLMGFLTILYGRPVRLSNSYVISLLFLIAGLGMFYFFAKSKNVLSRSEGFVLVLVYVAFILTEILVH